MLQAELGTAGTNTGTVLNFSSLSLSVGGNIPIIEKLKGVKNT